MLTKLVARFNRELLLPSAKFVLPQGVKYLFCGDSVFIRVSESDREKKTLKQLLLEYYGEDSTAVFAHSALAIQHYSLYLAVNKAQVGSLEKIVIPINYRSFSHQWEFNDEWRYLKTTKELIRLYNLIEFNLSDLFASGENQLPTNYFYYGLCQDRFFINQSKRRRDQINDIIEKRRKIFAYHYLFDIEVIMKSKRLGSIDTFSKIFSEFADRIIFFVPPINVEAICYLFEGDVERHVSSNVRYVAEFIEKRGFRCLDFSNSVDRFGFFNIFEPTEHLNEIGRDILLNKLTGVISNGSDWYQDSK
jgi:hypothetical protein